MTARRRLAQGMVAFLTSFLALTAAGCTGPDENNGNAASLQIEFDVFSGRENPVFDLEGTDAETVLALFGDVLPPGTPQTPPSVLGFRGFVMTGESLPGAGTLRSIRVVSDGYYLESTTGDTRFVDDPDPYGVLLPLMEDSFGVSLDAELPSLDAG